MGNPHCDSNWSLHSLCRAKQIESALNSASSSFKTATFQNMTKRVSYTSTNNVKYNILWNKNIDFGKKKTHNFIDMHITYVLVISGFLCSSIFILLHQSLEYNLPKFYFILLSFVHSINRWLSWLKLLS